jgi:hypothetical protein
MDRNRLRNLYHQLPTGFRNAILVKRRSPLWLSAGIVFVHIPKAAGTSINHALYGRFMGHARACEIRKWGSAALNALPTFAVTRNPWDRLLSAYRFARRGRGIGGAYQAAVKSPNQYDRPEFQSFELFVKEWLTDKNLSKLDGIFQPQSLFVCGTSREILVDHVGSLDDLRPTEDFIRRHLPKAPRIGFSNSSGQQIDYRCFYTDDLAEIVARIYRDDIEIFGYRFGVA